VAILKKLDKPNLRHEDVYATCTSRVSDANYKHCLNISAHEINTMADEYNSLADTEELFALAGIFPRRGEDPVVLNQLTRSQLTKLYSQQMVPADSPGRKIYDDIFVLANDLCPFCGGIGHTYTLDHYLPKANFPIYSIHPANLVPCCRDCNTGKGNNVAASLDSQTLHPYFDRDFYFTEKWVSARLISVNDPVLDFYVDPPAHWQQACKDRVITHFEAYKLKRRYKVESGVELSTLIHQRKTIMENLSPESFRQQLASISSCLSLPPNHWKRVMYTTLSQNEGFLSMVF
jgi:hypothetical protein